MTALDRRDPSPPITRLPRSDPLDTTPSLSCRSVWAVWPHGAIERNNGCDTVEPHITSERRGVIISAADSRAGGSRSILALCGRDERVGSSKRKTRPLTRQPRCDHLETAPSLSCRSVWASCRFWPRRRHIPLFVRLQLQQVIVTLGQQQDRVSHADQRSMVQDRGSDGTTTDDHNFAGCQGLDRCIRSSSVPASELHQDNDQRL
jgi:hypothetical protein